MFLIYLIFLWANKNYTKGKQRALNYQAIIKWIKIVIFMSLVWFSPSQGSTIPAFHMKWQISIWNVSKQLMVLLSIWFRKGSDTCKLNFHRKSFLYYLPLRLLFFPLVKWVFIWLYLVWGKSIAFKGGNLRLAHCFPLCGYGQTVCSRAEFANKRKTNLNATKYIAMWEFIFICLIINQHTSYISNPK